MKEKKFTCSDISRVLKVSRSTVSITLYRDINNLTFRTIKKYLKVVGLKMDIKRAISNR